MHLVVHPLTLEPASIGIGVDSKAVALAVLEVALVLLAIGVDEGTLAVHLPLLHRPRVQHGCQTELKGRSEEEE